MLWKSLIFKKIMISFPFKLYSWRESTLWTHLILPDTKEHLVLMSENEYSIYTCLVLGLG